MRLLHFSLAASLVAIVWTAGNPKQWVNPGDFYVGIGGEKFTEIHLGLVRPSEWEELEPKNLIVSFAGARMSGTCKIDLFGYSESDKTTISKTTSPFEKLASGSFKVISTATTHDVMELKMTCSSSCETYHMGYMEMTCTGINTKLYSPIIPLGWFVHPYYKSQKIVTWAQAHCQNWFHKEDKKVREALRSTSCHPSQEYVSASAAEYSFLEEQNIVRMDTYTAKSTRASRNIGPVQQCYLTTPAAGHVDADLHASPTAECCYGRPNSIGNSRWTFLFKEVEDPSTEFLLHGSTAYRSHPFGVDTRWTGHYLVGQVPHLSHWYWDLLPFRYCCLWWVGGCSAFYHKARPSPKLQPPSSSLTSALLMGNFIARPFATGSATPGAFMCNKLGTFWLMKTPSFKVQARAELMPESKSKIGVKNSRASKTSGPFITGLAFEVTALPNLRFQVVSSQTNYTYHVLVTDTHSNWTEKISESSRRKNFGYLTVSDSEFPESLQVQNLHLTYKSDQLGIKLFFPRFGQEFMSAMFSASAGTAVSGGLLGDVPAPGAHLIYQGAQCEKFRVPDADNLFVPYNENTIATSGSAATGKPATPAKAQSSTKELSITRKKLSDVESVACLATTYINYCRDIKDGLKIMEKFEATLKAGEPKKDPFPYCRSLPNFTAVVVSTHEQNSGLRKDDVMFMKCPSGYTRSSDTFTCSSDLKKTFNFQAARTVKCQLETENQKAFTKAVDWYSGQTGFKYDQHVEKVGGGPNSWRPGNSRSPPVPGGRGPGTPKGDGDEAGRLAASVALVAAAAAAASWLQLGDRTAGG